jgi:hypothetical protein
MQGGGQLMLKATADTARPIRTEAKDYLGLFYCLSTEAR